MSYLTIKKQCVVWRPVILVAICLWPIPAQAFYQSIADLFVKDLSFFGESPQSAVPFTSQAYCEAVIKTLAPNAVIIDGLMALEKIQRPQAEAAFTSCLPQIKSEWEKKTAKLDASAKLFKEIWVPFISAQDEQQKVAQAANDLAIRFQYAWRRILYNHHAFLRNGGKLSEVNKFCAQYQSDLVRDRVFAKKYPVASIHKNSPEGRTDYFSTYGLTEAEVIGVYYYSSNAHGEINKDLRNKNPLDSTKLFSEVVDAGLKKVKGYNGAVVRFDCLPPEVAADHKWGGVVSYPSFTSTSTDLNFSWSMNCGGVGWVPRRTVICTKGQGVNIKPISVNPHEDEVLFPTKAKFQVVEKYPVKWGGGQEIHVMVALDENGKPSTSPSFCEKEIKKFVAQASLATSADSQDPAAAIEGHKKEREHFLDLISKLEQLFKVHEQKSKSEISAIVADLNKQMEELEIEYAGISKKTGLSSEDQKNKEAEIQKKLSEVSNEYYGHLNFIDLKKTRQTIDEWKLTVGNRDRVIDILEQRITGKDDIYEEKLKKFKDEKEAFQKSKN